MDFLENMGKRAKAAAREVSKLSAGQKEVLLMDCANALLERQEEILAANQLDLEGNKTSKFYDRLKLNESRIQQMAEGLKQVALLQDPLSEYIASKTLPNGLMVSQKRVPLGVIGMIYEARPNVTPDAFALCFKAGNSVILRGGSEAIHSNKALVTIIQAALKANNITTDAVQLIENTEREVATRFMKLNDYLDVLIPRGGAGLIKSVVENSTVPVIETGVGNCHIYIDETADMQKATPIIINAKTQRPSVCNACEKLLIHKSLLDSYLPELLIALQEKGVVVKGDETISQRCGLESATEEDWYAEYGDLVLSIKSVASMDEAIAHISKYSSNHSEAILTENYSNARRFLDEVDSACVYVNASTRFTDGYEFGLGAEIGISTQKLHARGPMGLKELTSYKYVIYGNGQIRK